MLALLLSAAILMAATPTLRADSPSDLLEQGIYSEETKGDLDAALQLYQKVIDQSQADQSLAAKAQYHLGLCYYKKKDYTSANAAFAAVAKNYPDQKDIVALAQKYLAGTVALQPVPWIDGETMRLDVRLGGGLKIGLAEYAVHAGQTNGQKTWLFSSLVDAAGSQSVSHVETDAATLQPLNSRWKHSLLGEVDAVYFPDHAELLTVASGQTNRLDFDGSVVDNEEAIEWMRCLSFSNGYSISQQVLASLGNHVIPLKLTVTGPAQVQVPAGTYSCYEVALNIGQNFWYADDAKHYLVKFEAGGVVAELTGVTQRTAGEAASYSDSSFGFSLSAPPAWSFDKQEIDDTNKTSVSIIDPQAVAMSTLTVQTMTSAKTNETTSLRHFAEVRLAEDARELKNFQTRPDGWQDCTMAGQPAISAVSDYTQAGAKKVLYEVWTFGPANGNGASFYTHLAASDFDSFRPKFDQIIATFQNR